ncbi:hypothetical protein [Metabacillus litoralis]|nr:hypothetical protein [Metabacillus litoralis]
MGQKVIYGSRIHYFFFDHGNAFCEIQDGETQSIMLVNYNDLIHRVK